MDIHEDVTVTLPYWKWVYFLGWVDAQLPAGGQNNVLSDVIAQMASGVVP